MMADSMASAAKSRPEGRCVTDPAANAVEPSTGILFIFSAPSGAGKDTIIDRLKAESFDVHYQITCTTRPPRPYEVDGRHYYFLSLATFDQMRAQNEFLEWAFIHGKHYYGTPRQEVREALRQGVDVLLKIDVQGAEKVRSEHPDSVFIYLLPPSQEEVVSRMRQRGTEGDDLRRRIESLELEFGSMERYDYVVENPYGQVEKAVEKVKAIVIAERCRTRRRRFHI